MMDGLPNGGVAFENTQDWILRETERSRHYAPFAAPLLILDTSTLKKLTIKYLEFARQHSDARNDPKLNPFAVLDYLAKQMHLAIVIPRAVLREMLGEPCSLQEDMRCKDIYRHGKHYRINTDAEYICDESLPMLQWLHARQSEEAPDGRPYVRIYDSIDKFIQKEIGTTQPGIVIACTGNEEMPEIGTHGTVALPRSGRQHGDEAIIDLSDRLREIYHGKCVLPVLTEDIGLMARLKAHNPILPAVKGKKLAGYHEGVKYFLQGLVESPISPEDREAIRRYQHDMEYYFGQDSAERSPSALKHIGRARTWAEDLQLERTLQPDNAPRSVIEVNSIEAPDVSERLNREPRQTEVLDYTDYRGQPHKRRQASEETAESETAPTQRVSIGKGRNVQRVRKRQGGSEPGLG